MGIVLATIAITGCTDQQRAKGWGGTATVDLPAGKKLVTATWKENALWYLTRPMRPDETPETFELQESSSMGLVEGTVIFKEHAAK